MSDLVPWLEIEPGPPALEEWSLSQWTTREIQLSSSFSVNPLNVGLPQSSLMEHLKVNKPETQFPPIHIFPFLFLVYVNGGMVGGLLV